MDNIRGGRDGEESGGGKFNPFRILEIGESMTRYCDGIRIKNYSFLAILTSDRLVLMDSAKQSAGTIAKEIPVSMIQGAVFERDEKDRPSLAVSMEVGGQTRLMKLVFSGLIDEPETECREWFTAINGYPPEPEEKPVPEPEPLPVSEPVLSSPPVEVPPVTPVPPVSQVVQEPAPINVAKEAPPEVPAPPAPIQAAPVPEPVIQAPAPVPVPESVPAFSPEPASLPPDAITKPVPAPQIPVKNEPVSQPVQNQRLSVSAPGDDSVQICIEKPGITPIFLERKTLVPEGSSTGKSRFCIHCGVRIPGLARFCPVCGKTQV